MNYFACYLIINILLNVVLIILRYYIEIKINFTGEN